MVNTIYEKIKNTLSKYEDSIELLDFTVLQSYIDLLFSMAEANNK